MLQLTKARLEGEEMGQPLAQDCHVLLGAPINYATLWSGLKHLLSCAVGFQIARCCEVLKRPDATATINNKTFAITTLYG